MKHSSSLIEVDGSHGEGGGGLLRTCLQMAVLTQQGVHISGIRGGTNHPGLDLEDVMIARTLAAACGAEMEGGEAASQELTFVPSRRLAKVGPLAEVDPSTGRGANALVVLTSLIAPIARSGCFGEASAIGETYGHASLTFDYVDRVCLPALRRMGIYASAEMETASFGRDRYGKVRIECEPSAIEPLDWSDRGRLIGVRACIAYAGQPGSAASRARQHLENLAASSGIPLVVESREITASGPGLAVTAYAEFERGLGGSVQVPARWMRVETAAQAAFEAIADLVDSDASVDPHLIDLLIVPAVFAPGESHFRVRSLTRRFLTIVWAIKQFLPIHIIAAGDQDGPGEITVRPS